MKQLSFADQPQPLPPMPQIPTRHVRQTSIETYHAVKNSGLIGIKQFQVYGILFASDPLTQSEVLQLMTHKDEFTQHSITPRFAELERAGVIGRVEKRVCRVTGRKCWTWTTTNRQPVAPERKPSKDQIIQQQQDRIRALEAKLLEAGVLL